MRSLPLSVLPDTNIEAFSRVWGRGRAGKDAPRRPAGVLNALPGE